jgi:hypothetical protein
MTTITIPSNVAELMRQAAFAARLVDEQGNVLGSFFPARGVNEELTPEQFAEIKRRMKSPGPRHTTEQVLAFLDSRENPQ